MMLSLIVTVKIIIVIFLEEALSDISKGEFQYKDVSEISDMTEESFPEGL